MESGFQLIEHLKESPECLPIGRQPLQTALLEFPCLGCSLEKGKRLLPHLNRLDGENCREMIFDYFNIEDADKNEGLKKLSRIVANIKRMSHPSRTPEARKLETERDQSRKGPLPFLRAVGLGTPLKQRSDYVDTETPIIRSHVNLLPNGVGMLSPVASGNHNGRFSSVLLPVGFFDPAVFGLPRNPKKRDAVSEDIERIDMENLYPYIYEAEVKKILDCQISSVKRGRIVDMERREITLQDNAINTFRVLGSTDFYLREQENLMTCFEQLGPLCMLTKMHILPLSKATIASRVRKDGHSVKMSIDPENLSLEYSGSKIGEEGELTLDDFVSDSVAPGKFDELEDYVGVYTMWEQSHHVFSKFVRLLISDEKIPLGSKLYDGTVNFPVDGGMPEVMILTWPAALKSINGKIARNEPILKDDLQQLVEFIDSSLTVASKEEDLMNQFNLSLKAAKEVKKLTLSFSRQRKLQQLSSLATMIVTKSKIVDNIEDLASSYAQLRSYVQLHLEMLRDWDSLDVDTGEWLLSLENSVELVEGLSSVVVFFPDSSEVEFLIEEEVTTLKSTHSFTTFTALYHRSLTFSTECSLSHVLHCPTLQSCYVLPYNPIYLLCAKSNVTSRLVGKGHRQLISDIKKIPHDDTLENIEVLREYAVSHCPVSIFEALTRNDKSRGFVVSSVRPSFVNVGPFRQTKFLRSNAVVHDTDFYEPITGVWYKEYHDEYDNYLDRPQSLEKICLFQFVSSYRKLRSSQADLDSDDEEEENACEVHMAVDNDDWDINTILPKKVRIPTGEIYVYRSPRVVSYKRSEDRCRPEVILFRHHRRAQTFLELNDNSVTRIHEECDIFPEYVGEIKLTKVETVKRRLEFFNFYSFEDDEMQFNVV